MKNNNKTKHHYNWMGKHILIIDPDPHNCRLWEIHLSPTAAQCSFCTNAHDAGHFLHGGHHMDLLLLEVFLPLEKGLEIIRKCKKGNPSVPILVQTVLAFNKVKRACLEAGCDGFWIKPLNFLEVMAEMEGWLGKVTYDF